MFLTQSIANDNYRYVTFDDEILSTKDSLIEQLSNGWIKNSSSRIQSNILTQRDYSCSNSQILGLKYFKSELVNNYTTINSNDFFITLLSLEHITSSLFEKKAAQNHIVSLQPETTQYVITLTQKPNIPWLSQFKQKASKIKKVKSLVHYYEKIDTWQIEKNYSMCDYFLRSLDVKELSLTLLIGLPRLLSRSQHHLNYWHTYCTITRDELYKREQDGAYLMRGIDF